MKEFFRRTPPVPDSWNTFTKELHTSPVSQTHGLAFRQNYTGRDEEGRHTGKIYIPSDDRKTQEVLLFTEDPTSGDYRKTSQATEPISQPKERRSLFRRGK